MNLLYFKKNDSFNNGKKRITIELLFERSGLTDRPSVSGDTALLGDQVFLTTTATFMISSFSLIQFLVSCLEFHFFKSKILIKNIIF